MYKKYHLDLKDYKKSLKLKGYAKTTIENYSNALLSFLEYTNKCRSHLTEPDIDKYMISISEWSYSKKNQSISSIKLFYKYVLNKKIKTNKLERPRKIHALPDILSQDEVVKLIDSYHNLKHKCTIATLYYFGLRRSELPELRLNDFDKNRGLLHIKQAKGNKDRFVCIQDQWREIANKYVIEYEIKDLLFKGDHGKYTFSSLRSVLDQGLKRCNITKHITLHSLRRSFACHLYERGVSLLAIQKILGHKNYKTTLIYVQVSEKCYEEAVNIFN